MVLLFVSIFAFLVALGPAVLFFRNLKQFRVTPTMYDFAGFQGATSDIAAAGSLSPAHRGTGQQAPEVHTTIPSNLANFVSVLIPARNEENSIGSCIEHVLSNRHAHFELIVLDDHSRDRTGEIVSEFAARDPRVRLASAPPLPLGWCGKQHACQCLADLAAHDFYLFLDADVRLSEDAIARSLAFLEPSGAALVSGFPRQVTGSPLETLLLPLIHFVLLGFLPIARMRSSTRPAYGAGCGQFFLARKEAYQAAGGHAAIRASLHDGITLPRAFRRAGFATDLFDATDIASCRMYYGAKQTWQGLAKNATEGMASPTTIFPWTVILVGGQVLPWILLKCGFYGVWFGTPCSTLSLLLAGISVILSVAARLSAAGRFRQSVWSALLHPAGIMLLLTVQWHALFRKLSRKPAIWRGRDYPA